jgi:hypothetical protein
MEDGMASTVIIETKQFLMIIVRRHCQTALPYHLPKYLVDQNETKIMSNVIQRKDY